MFSYTAKPLKPPKNFFSYHSFLLLGENLFFGEYLNNAEGEDVVSGMTYYLLLFCDLPPLFITPLTPLSKLFLYVLFILFLYIFILTPLFLYLASYLQSRVSPLTILLSYLLITFVPPLLSALLGVRTPMPVEKMKEHQPAVYESLMTIQQQLERHYRDMQDIEFTVENGKLYILQVCSRSNDTCVILTTNNA